MGGAGGRGLRGEGADDAFGGEDHLFAFGVLGAVCRSIELYVYMCVWYMYTTRHTAAKGRDSWSTYVGVVGQDDLEETLGMSAPDQGMHEVAVLWFVYICVLVCICTYADGWTCPARTSRSGSTQPKPSTQVSISICFFFVPVDRPGRTPHGVPLKWMRICAH